jgi:hypothetical protein
MEETHMSDDQEKNKDLEQRKIDLEYDKLKQEEKIEQAKFEVERSKARWTALSIFIPLIAIAITLVFNHLSALDKAKADLALETKKVKADFLLKSAEIIMSKQIGDPYEAQMKAKVLSQMFPDALPADLATRFDPSGYDYPVWSESNAENIFLRMIAQKTNKREFIQIWKALFPNDEPWLHRVEGVVSKQSE